MKTFPEVLIAPPQACFFRRSELISGVTWHFRPLPDITVAQLWEIISAFPAHIHAVDAMRQGFGFRNQIDSDAFANHLGADLARHFRNEVGALINPFA